MSWPLLIALLAGALLPLQTGINAELRSRLGHPVLAAAASMSISLGLLTTCAVSLRLPLPSFAGLIQIPWWCWLGGVVGAIYLSLSIALAPRLGASAFISASLAGQMFASIVVDHLGLVGYRVRQANSWQLFGASLIVVGVFIIQRR